MEFFYFARLWNAIYTLSRLEDNFPNIAVIFKLGIVSLPFEGHRVGGTVYNTILERSR
jgi:hypothetical protein